MASSDPRWHLTLNVAGDTLAELRDALDDFLHHFEGPNRHASAGMSIKGTAGWRFELEGHPEPPQADPWPPTCPEELEEAPGGATVRYQAFHESMPRHLMRKAAEQLHPGYTATSIAEPNPALDGDPNYPQGECLVRLEQHIDL